MTPHGSHNQYGSSISYLESHLKRKPSSDPPYIRMLTSPWDVASNAVEDINAMQELLSLDETSSGIDMKSGSTTDSAITIRSEDTNTSTLANISLDEDNIDDERSLSVHSICSVSVRTSLFF